MPIYQSCITRNRDINMAFKVFADANILLDFTLKREGYDVAK